MKSVVSKLLWRIALPFVLAFVIAVVQILEMEGRLSRSFFPVRISLFGGAILFCVFFGIALRNALHWGKEAEEFESELKEADEIEKERRRRADWIVRE